MSEWLSKIQAELTDVSGEDNVEPEEPAGSRDHVVGVANPELRKLFYLFHVYKQKTMEAASAMMMLRGTAREEKEQEAATYSAQAELIKDIFWVSCRHDFPILWDKSNIGIRKSWEVVWTEPSERSAGMDLMGALVSGSALAEMLRRAHAEDDGDEAAGPSSKLH